MIILNVLIKYAIIIIMYQLIAQIISSVRIVKELWIAKWTLT